MSKFSVHLILINL